MYIYEHPPPSSTISPTIPSPPTHTPSGPNTTGLFLYGLRVDPLANSAFIRVEPGESHVYTYTIPADHPTGLFWYHDPTHGAAMLHVMGGLFGAIYVDLPVRLIAIARRIVTSTDPR